ncbi:hypothetical protein BW721_08555 [Jeotgalibaca sp. PTS2502]|uniref:hypothetical protein n=1 Tax=Jeotgalibaca sp. PTS2502 TaxID=1903686 RepID=UPI0009739DC8|nr:hypothetical protein [Jeotgalibaca sp. PTS2502]APZ49705.1 hypothetical protein BW721_08555 [Jeotgalibaca sp. PTS2502]
MKNKINKDQLKALNSDIYEIILSIKMSNNWIDLVKNPSSMSVEDMAFHYTYTYNALEDVFDINQANIDKLNAITSFLIDLQDNLE